MGILPLSYKMLRFYTEGLCFFSYPKQAYIEDSNNLALMPTFLDITGLEDEESEINKEMLRILFNGKLKEREDLNSVRQKKCIVGNSDKIPVREICG
jgi:hypothetical protein